MPFLMAGTDLICSGMGAIPRYDNSFNASLFNAEDTEDYLALQRDYLVEGGLRHVPEDELVAVRRRAVAAMAAVLEELGLAEPSEQQLLSVVYAHGSDDTRTFSLGELGVMNDAVRDRGLTMVDVIRALAARGFARRGREPRRDGPAAGRRRLSADGGHRAERQGGQRGQRPQPLCGPGTGHVMTPAPAQPRSCHAQRAVARGGADRAGALGRRGAAARDADRAAGRAALGKGEPEVVVGLSPAFLTRSSTPPATCRSRRC